jgi:hypothetical protein
VQLLLELTSLVRVHPRVGVAGGRLVGVVVEVVLQPAVVAGDLVVVVALVRRPFS